MRSGLRSPPAQMRPLGDFSAFASGGNGASPRSQGIIPPYFPSLLRSGERIQDDHTEHTEVARRSTEKASEHEIRGQGSNRALQSEQLRSPWISVRPIMLTCQHNKAIIVRWESDPSSAVR